MIQRMSQSTIILTKVACQHVQSQLVKHPEAMGIRLSIKKSGCSGYAYHIDLTDTQASDDQVFIQPDGLRVFVDPQSWVYFDQGLVIDYVPQGMGHQWQFQNPKEKGSCGCGESVSF